MIGAAVNIGQGAGEDAWSASNGELYCIFAAITLTHGLINSLASRINARLQTVFVIANLLVIFVTFIALPATTKHRNSPSFVFGNIMNLSDGWPTGFGMFSISEFSISTDTLLQSSCSVGCVLHGRSAGTTLQFTLPKKRPMRAQQFPTRSQALVRSLVS